MKALYLKKGEDRRLRVGHLWVFSNEVDTRRSPLVDFAAGEPVRVVTAEDRPVGVGYVNPASLICCRLVSRDARAVWGAELLERRLRRALALREALFDEPCYRLVFGEGDYLPGLVVDRYHETLAVQIGTAGVERLTDVLLETLQRLLRPTSILLRNDSASRELEGLERYIRPALGEVPAEVEVVESGCRFAAPFATGQKTGWFYDQRPNREGFAALTQGRRVLDVFSYVGALGVAAARAGASEVVCVDASETAAAYVTRNARTNGVDPQVRVLQGDAFDVLGELARAGERFEAVFVDPPAFIKRRRDREAGLTAYQRLNRLAMDLLTEDGLLMSCSCSQHLSREDLLRLLLKAAGRDRRVQLLSQGGQGPDHPVHPAMPETDYLKSFLLRVWKE